MISVNFLQLTLHIYHYLSGTFAHKGEENDVNVEYMEQAQQQLQLATPLGIVPYTFGFYNCLCKKKLCECLQFNALMFC